MRAVLRRATVAQANDFERQRVHQREQPPLDPCITWEFIKSAELTVEFGVEPTAFDIAQTYGQWVRCVVVLTDSRGRQWQHTRMTNCAPHDPKRERRSTRALNEPQDA